MSRVLFGQSYFLRFDPKLHEAMQPYAPLGTLCAASYLRRRGHEVALFDAMLAESEQEWAVALDVNRPSYAVLYEDNFNYLSKMCLARMRQAAFLMIAAAKERGCFVIASGADMTDHPDLYLARGADFVIQGEGEESLARLIALLDGRDLASVGNIPGLVWRDARAAVQTNRERSYLTELDDLPLPAWDLVDVPRYRNLWKSRHGYFSMNMVTTRGCPYHCNWCAKPIWGQRYNSRSPESVVSELGWLKEQYNPDHIWFADDIFGLKAGWIARFGMLAEETGAAIPFKCQMRADLLSPAVVAGLKAGRCDSVWLGAESGSQRVLDAMEKGTTVEQIREARRLLAAAGIKTGFFLQFGYPGETREEVESTLQLVRDALPDDIGISVSYPLPGTRFYNAVRTQLGEKRNWEHSDDLAMLYRGPFPEPFYRTLYRATHSEFRLRKAFEMLRRAAAQSHLLDAANLRTLTRIPGHWLSWRLQQLRLSRFAAPHGNVIRTARS